MRDEKESDFKRPIIKKFDRQFEKCVLYFSIF